MSGQHGAGSKTNQTARSDSKNQPFQKAVEKARSQDILHTVNGVETEYCNKLETLTFKDKTAERSIKYDHHPRSDKTPGYESWRRPGFGSDSIMMVDTQDVAADALLMFMARCNRMLDADTIQAKSKAIIVQKPTHQISERHCDKNINDKPSTFIVWTNSDAVETFKERSNRIATKRAHLRKAPAQSWHNQPLSLGNNQDYCCPQIGYLPGSQFEEHNLGRFVLFAWRRWEAKTMTPIGYGDRVDELPSEITTSIQL